MTSSHDTIAVRGARTHNLKNINLDLPRDKLIVVTGLSGSGKSSLAFDTLYAEGQRRYVESLSAYARQFLSMMDKPDVDHIDGLSPAISIEQKATSHNPRSTVGTITEIYDYLRLLFARVGEPRCPTHGHKLDAQTISEIVDHALAFPEGSRAMVLAPVIEDRKGEHEHVFAELAASGYVRARIDGIVAELDAKPKLHKNRKHTIEAVVDRLVLRADNQQRLAESFETALELGEGRAFLVGMDDGNTIPETIYSNRYACPACGYAIAELEPRMFSFNSPHGACETCDGLGTEQSFAPERVIVDPESSLAEGACMGWNRSTRHYFHLFSRVAEHYGFDVETPWRRLKKEYQDIVLHGSGDERIDFSFTLRNGREIKRHFRYEGVLPMLARRMKDTSSDGIREHLANMMTNAPCSACQGSRLREETRNVFIDNKNIDQITAFAISDALEYFNRLQFKGQRRVISEKILIDIRARLQFLNDVGLNYLTLNRSAGTLSGGEAQRIRLASQIGAGLVGVLYILDEPSIGLHQRDNGRLLNTLCHLRDIGNTVIIVEHDEEAIRTADHVVDIGPGAGVHGGTIVAQGTIAEVARSTASITGDYLARRRTIEIPRSRTPFNPKRTVKLTKAKGNNLRNIDVEIPVGLFTCVTGVSGSGKSTFVNQTLYPITARELNRATSHIPKAYGKCTGLQHLDKVVEIDQSPIGRTPRSNPATYTQLFTPIRELFARTQEARARGYQPGRFSFNVKGGRCEACQGDGLIKVEMHFLPDVYVRCDVCEGKRYNRETLEVRYKGKNIHEVLDMDVEEAAEFFAPIPNIHKKLQTLHDVGLSYIRLGQSATTLSGGEAQRVKLAKELSKADTGSTLYILDEPTTGLHFYDIQHLLNVLQRLRDKGNTVIVIEHNLDVIKTADWVIDLGPEGGSGGGRVVATGTPEQLTQIDGSHTGQFLRAVLEPAALSRAAG
ncbi:MAG: excinuclease ABC subunit UvrA [Gammaproteobacteria bacterium]|nr:excinuclease ABC subunit UvrA [Gammaproteobacteria bacterium]